MTGSEPGNGYQPEQVESTTHSFAGDAGEGVGATPRHAAEADLSRAGLAVPSPGGLHYDGQEGPVASAE